MLRTIKKGALRVLYDLGVFELVANSRWRQQRLLIICYHGVSLEDEHLWRPVLYMPPALFQKRLEILKNRGYSVVGLSNALERLWAGNLPPKSVAITFDDGTYDFYSLAYPQLRRYNFPVTVYQTTYYSDHEFPIFNLICSYMLWKKRDTVLPQRKALGINEPVELRTEASRHQAVRHLIDFAECQHMSGQDKNQLAAELAIILEIDYQELRKKRLLQLMNKRELQEIAKNGVDIQLHTHRHRTPEDESLFRHEIEVNRTRIREWIGNQSIHFCYPGGFYKPAFLRWLQKEQIASATTCDAGCATRKHKPLLLPRFVDSQHCTQAGFESWISGVGDLLALRRRAPQRYIPLDNKCFSRNS